MVDIDRLASTKKKIKITGKYIILPPLLLIIVIGFMMVFNQGDNIQDNLTSIEVIKVIAGVMLLACFIYFFKHLDERMIKTLQRNGIDLIEQGHPNEGMYPNLIEQTPAYRSLVNKDNVKIRKYKCGSNMIYQLRVSNSRTQIDTTNYILFPQFAGNFFIIPNNSFVEKVLDIPLNYNLAETKRDELFIYYGNVPEMPLSKLYPLLGKQFRLQGISQGALLTSIGIEITTIFTNSTAKKVKKVISAFNE